MPSSAHRGARDFGPKRVTLVRALPSRLVSLTRSGREPCCTYVISDIGYPWPISTSDAIVIADVFGKKTRRTPQEVVERCGHRLRNYDVLGEEQT